MPHRITAIFVPLCVVWVLTLSARGQGYRDVIGYGSASDGTPEPLLARGSGIAVGQVEVFPAGTGNYIPDTSLPVFAGKVFTLRSGASGVSPHATQVANSLYSSETGAAPNVSSITLFSAESFVSGLLRAGRRTRAPGASGVMVINNSWVASYPKESTNVEVVRRLDDLINRDQVLVFNAVENANDGSFPKLLASSYNGISVGTLAGSRGPVAFDSAGGRIKPDLIVPLAFTSDATAVASGAGALLLSEARARQVPMNQLAAKAVLMAGAQRDDTWQRGAAGVADDKTAPLDYAQGAGKLRVDRSFEILTSGRALAVGAPGADPSYDARGGWDSSRTDKRSKSATYLLKVSQDLEEWSSVLTWNRVIAGLNSKRRYNSTPTLADMTLSLYKKPTGKRQYLIASSDSENDNVESLTLHDLAAGNYFLVVTSSVRTRYGISWFAGEDAAGADPSQGLLPMNLSMSGSGTGAAGFAQVPEPPLFFLIIPIAALLCYWRPARAHVRMRVDESATIDRLADLVNRTRSYPNLPTRLKFR